ncbi:MAG TPA: hypothetical protein VHW65_04210 [Gemmatimonadales bacterium]|jgi:hypothetical protein|nr:hypothetical protein [Gemmatimonadales bacterium]
MSAPPISPNPLGDAAPTEDQVPLAVRSMLAAVAAGLTWFAALTFLVATFAGNTAQTLADVNPNAAYVNFLVYGAVLGVVFTAFMAWHFMTAVASNYRRGGLAMVAAFAGSVISGALTVMIRQLAGSRGLAGLCAVALVITVILGRRARAEAERLRRLAA